MKPEIATHARLWSQYTQGERQRIWNALNQSDRQELRSALTSVSRPRTGDRLLLSLLVAVGLAALAFIVVALLRPSENPSQVKTQASVQAQEKRRSPPADERTDEVEPTRASQSVYNRDIRRATTSRGLTKADLAWHAVNTYGWDCSEVVSRSDERGGYYVITCSSGTELRVYPRPNQHPRITNIRGGYD